MSSNDVYYYYRLDFHYLGTVATICPFYLRAALGGRGAPACLGQQVSSF